MKIESVFTEKAPSPIGPYSQAVRSGDFLFISGQIPLDPLSGNVVGSTIQEQAFQALKNLKNILNAQGLTTSSLVKTTVFIRDISQFGLFNAIYEQEMQGAKPARSVVEVSALPRDVLVEIEAIACQ